jgi:hypothetical protein
VTLEKDDKWLKSLRGKMDDYELMPPDNIWESIDKQLSHADSQKQFVIGRKIWITVAATLLIMVCSVFTIHFMNRYDDQIGNIAKNKNTHYIKSKNNSVNTKLTANTNVSETKSVSSLSSVTRESMNADKGRRNNKDKRFTATSESTQMVQIVSAVCNTQDSTTIVTENIIKTNEIAVNTKQQNTSIRRNTDLPPAKDGERLIAMSDLNKKKNENTWSFSLGTTMSTSNLSDDGDAFNSCQSSNNFPSVCTPTDNRFENENDKFLIGYTKIELKHHRPIKIGFTIEKRINKNFGIASGLTSTYLLSTTEDNYLNNENDQRIYYIGIPIKINYHFFDKRKFSLYWSNGLEAEKCIYARRSGEHLHLDRIQMSINTSFGAEYLIAPKLSIYAEPGLSYYWGNGTKIETYRTKNPLSFDLHVGLKLNY